MTMRTTATFIVAGALSVAFAGAPATAQASPSCIAQSVETFAPGELGPTISGYARTYPPLGRIISYEATSPKNDCPPE